MSEIEVPKFRCYLAGPIDACTYDEIHGWRDMLKKDYPDIDWVDPSTRSYDNQKDWQRLVDDDLEDIASSDALLAYFWKNGSGTSMELVYAFEIYRLPVVVVVPHLDQVGPWVQYHSDHIVDNFQHAYDLLSNYPERG